MSEDCETVNGCPGWIQVDVMVGSESVRSSWGVSASGVL